MYTFEQLLKDGDALEAMMNQLIDLDTKVGTSEDTHCRYAYSKLNDAKEALKVIWMLTNGKAA